MFYLNQHKIQTDQLSCNEEMKNSRVSRTDDSRWVALRPNQTSALPGEPFTVNAKTLQFALGRFYFEGGRSRFPVCACEVTQPVPAGRAQPTWGAAGTQPCVCEEVQNKTAGNTQKDDRKWSFSLPSVNYRFLIDSNGSLISFSVCDVGKKLPGHVSHPAASSCAGSPQLGLAVT